MDFSSFASGGGDSVAASSQGGGVGADPDPAIFYGRPEGGGTGGIYQRAWNQQPGLPYGPPTGSGHGARDVAAGSFRELDSLIVRYVDHYLSSLPNRDTSGNTSIHVTGSDDVGSFTFDASVSYDYQETGNPTGTFSVNDTDGFSYSFHETGVSAGGVTFTVDDTGSASSSSTLGTGSGTDTGGTHSLTNTLLGSDTYTVVETVAHTGTLGSGSASSSDTLSLQHAGSNSFTLTEARTETVDSSNAVTSGANASTWDETGVDTVSSSSWNQQNSSATDTGGTASYSSTSSLTESSVLNHSIHFVASDALGSAGLILSGNRTLTFNALGTDSYTDHALSNQSTSLTSGDTTWQSATATESGTSTSSLHEDGTEDYSASGGYTWDESGTDALSLSDTGASTMSGSAVATSNVGGVTTSLTSGSSGTTTSTQVETGPITQSLHETGLETFDTGTISSGSNTDAWNETGTLTSTASETDSATTSETMTSSSTLEGVTSTATTTQAATDSSTLTSTDTDTMSLNETGDETYGTGGLVASGSATLTLSNTASGTSSSTGTAHAVQTATTTLISTLGGVTANETIQTTGSEDSTDTGNGSSGSTAVLTRVESLGGGGVLAGSTDSHTLSASGNPTETLASTATDTTTDTVVQSSTLGGVTATSTLSTTATDTATSHVTTTASSSQSADDTVTSASGAVTGGNSTDSGSETSSDTHTSTLTSHVTSSSSGSASSNLGGSTTTSTLTASGIDDSTATNSGTRSGYAFQSSSSVAGTLALLSSGSSSDSTSYSSLDSHSLSDVATATSSDTSTVTATAGGVTSTDNLTETSTSTQTTTMSGAAAASTETMTATTTVGAGGIVSSGDSTDSGTQTDVVSTSTTMTASETSQETETSTSTLGGVTTSLSQTSTLSSSPSSAQWGDVTQTSSALNSYILGFDGVIASGTLTHTGDSTSTLTTSQTHSDLATTTLVQTSSSTLSAATTSETLSATHTITTTGSASSTMTATMTGSSTETLGSGGIISSGISADSLYQTGNDTGGQTVTDTAAAITSSASSFSSTNALSSSSSSSTLTSTLTLISSSNDTPTLSQTDDLTMGWAGVSTGGSSSQTLDQTGSTTNETTLTSTETDHIASNASTNSAGATTTRSISEVEAISSSGTLSNSLTTTLAQGHTMTLGAAGLVLGGTQSSTLTTSGTDSHSLFESDSDTSDLTGHDTGQVDVAQTSTTLSDHATGLSITIDVSTSTSSGTTTDSTTYGTSGLVSGGGSTDSSQATATATHSVSDETTTTLSHSISETLAASTSGNGAQTTSTGTLTHTTTLSSPSTSTLTSSGTLTIGASAVVSGGVSSDSLYETAVTTSSDFETGTLTSTVIGGGHMSNVADSSAATNTSTATLIDSSQASSGQSTTLISADTQTLGTNAAIAGGDSSQSIQTTGSDTYSLYETSSETHSDVSSGSQGANAGALNISAGLTGSESSSRTSTFTDSLTSGHSVTMILGGDGTITGGSSTDTLSESGTTTDAGLTIGTNVHHATVGSDTTTFTSTYTITDASSDSQTHATSSSEAYGTAGRVTSGFVLDTLLSFGTLSHTLDEDSDKTVSWNTTNSHGGTYTVTESTSNSHTESNSSSLALGTDGTIASGLMSTSSTTSDTFSHSAYEIGSEQQSDSSGGPAYLAPFGLHTQITHQSTNDEQNSLTLGAAGTIAGGTDSAHFTQNDTSTRTLNVNTLTDSVDEIGAEAYSYDDTRSETFGPGGTVSAGWESYTWGQSSNDSLTMHVQGGGATQAQYRYYSMGVTDYTSDVFYDVGSKLLGANDSVLASTDAYHWQKSRESLFTISDLGSTDTPYSIFSQGSDGFSQDDTGSSTLTTDGHVLSTDTYTWHEASSDNSSTSETGSNGATASLITADGNDSYSNDDVGTITRSDATVITYDSFTLDNSRAVNVSTSESGSNSGVNFDLQDSAWESESLHAQGTKGDNGVYSYDSQLAAGDTYALNEALPGSYTLAAAGQQNRHQAVSGWNATGALGTSYYTTLSVSDYNSTTAAGETTDDLGAGGITATTGFTDRNTAANLQRMHVSGPPESVVTDEETHSDTSSGSIPGEVNLTAFNDAGHALNAASHTAGRMGGYPSGGAIHPGTASRPLDDSSGLLSGLGGEGVHAMMLPSSGGFDYIQPEISIGPDADGNWGLLDGSPPVGESGPAPWRSHPESLGFRSAPPSGGGGADSARTSPRMDSGTPQGGTDDELGRLNQSYAGGNENPSVTRDAPPGAGDQKTRQLYPGSGGDDTNGFGRTPPGGWEDPNKAYWDTLASDYSTRVLGTVQAVGGLVEGATGLGLVILSPEPLTKVGGGILVLHGADSFSAGTDAMISGHSRSTYTATGVSAAAQSVGIPKGTADAIGMGTDAGIGGFGTIKGGMILSGLRAGSGPAAAGVSSAERAAVDAASGGASAAARVAPSVGVHAPRVPATQGLANEIANVGLPRSKQTVVLIETAEGRTIVAAGGPDLTPAQKALAKQRGLSVADDLPGFHGELTGMATAGERGLLPTRGVTTNKMCRDGAYSCFDQLTDMARRGGYELRLSPDGRSFEFIKAGGN